MKQAAANTSNRLSRLTSRRDSNALNRILIVEDSKKIRDLLSRYLSNLGGFQIYEASTLEQAKEILKDDSLNFSCSICDLSLPDAEDGAAVDLLRSFGLPVIVLTSVVDDKLREAMLSKQVIDYVIKGTSTEIEHVAYVVARLCENEATKVLVVDDSASFRDYIQTLLNRYRYRTFSAVSGAEALTQIGKHPDISLVITEYHMPDMNGQELIQAIRKNYRREDLAIIGVASTTDSSFTAKLLKSGANDFLSKSFEEEEFYCRVTQNTNLVSYVRQVRDSATRDFLTGLFNRRHLFEIGNTLWENAKRGQICLGAALVDADFFKKINDNFGHDVGDKALKAIADELQKALRKSDIVARYGGEEFASLAVLKKPEDAFLLYERMRKALEAIVLTVDGEKVPITASIGVTTSLESNLDTMFGRADEALYKAKAEGRNRVVVDHTGSAD